MIPRVVWPAPGSPSVGAGDGRGVRVVVAHGGDGDDALRDWSSGWHLGARPPAEAIPLGVAGLSQIDPPAEVAAFAALPEHRGLRYLELRLAAVAPLASRARRSAVFDLVSPRQVERARSVAWFAEADELRLAFASDIHVAALWDDVADAVERHAPDLSAQLAHPGTNLRRFVADVNRRARAGEVDVVVFGGDLVDHVYTRPRAEVTGSFAQTNVSRFLAAIDDLEVPSFVVPGNHDYRLYPWRPRAYGLHAARVPKPRLRALLERAGWWDRWPLRRSDLDALATENDAERSALHHHLTHLSPSTDHDVRIASTGLVFLDSGRDLVPRWRTVARSRYPLLVRSLPGSWTDPDSEGLSDRQLAYLDAVLARPGGAAVFCHAPLLASPAGPVPSLVPRLDVERFASDLGFERHLAVSRARTGVLFHNPAAIVRLLRATRDPLTWFSGHVHRRGGFFLARRSGAVGDLAQPSDDRDRVDFVQAPSLGLHGAQAEDHPGFLLAELRGGAIAAHRYVELGVGSGVRDCA